MKPCQNICHFQSGLWRYDSLFTTCGEFTLLSYKVDILY